MISKLNKRLNPDKLELLKAKMCNNLNLIHVPGLYRNYILLRKNPKED